jgi:hypothetical protein
MDPATLVIAALIYFATQAGQEISSKVASALGDAAAVPVKKLVEKISGDSATKRQSKPQLITLRTGPQ